MPWKKINNFFFQFFQQKSFETIAMMYNINIFTMMYMFIIYIYTKYIKAHIHQALNPKPHENTPWS
jgi:hypothetical protein